MIAHMIVHMNDHKNKNMLGSILKDIEHFITFKIKFERPEIQGVNVFNSIIGIFVKRCDV